MAKRPISDSTSPSLSSIDQSDSSDNINESSSIYRSSPPKKRDAAGVHHGESAPSTVAKSGHFQQMALRCHLYKPFVGEVVTGAESSFEQVAVNLKDLSQLERQIAMSSAVNVVGLFGHKSSVVDAARQLLDLSGEEFNLPTVDEQQDKNGSLYAVVKGSQVLLMVVANDSFLFPHEAFNKEHLLVTFFRYLEDASSLIFLCPDKTSIDSFSPGTKNPFSSIGHATTMFKLEERKSVEDITEVKVKSNTNLLTQEFGEKALRRLVLNDNGSRFFLHYELHDMSEFASLDSDSILRKLLKPVFFKNWQNTHYKYSFHNELKTAANELSFDCIQNLICAHNNFVSKLDQIRLSFSSVFRTQVEKTKSVVQSKIHRGFFSTLRQAWSPPVNYNSVTELCAEQLISGILDSFRDEDKTFAWDTKKAYDDMIEYTAQFLANNLKLKDTTILIDELLQDVNFDFSELRFHQFLSNRAEDVTVASRKFIFDCKTSINNDQKRKKTASIVRVTPCALNVVQSNEGVFETMTFAPLPWAVDITAEVLFKLIPPSLRKSVHKMCIEHGKEAVSDEAVRGLRITSCYPIWNGKFFLATLRSEHLPGMTSFVTISSDEVKGVRAWQSDNLIISYESGEKSTDPVLMAVIANDNDVSLHEFSQNDSVIKLTSKGSFSVPSQIRGKIISSTILPDRKEMLFLTNSGNCYSYNLGKKEVVELCHKTNTGKKLERKKLTTENGDTYKSVHVAKNQNFFVLRAESSTDVYNANLTRLKSFPTVNCRSLKIYWDNANAYLSLLHGGKRDDISSFVFPDVCSDISLRVVTDEESKAGKEGCRGNPVIDVVYASFLKYGPQARFIGSRETIDYKFVCPKDCSAESVEQSLRTSLQSYNRTFSPKLTIELEQCGKLNINSPDLEMPSDRLRSVLLSRVPVHICTIEDNNVVPLIDGKRHQITGLDVVSDIANLAERVSFGHLETVLSTLASDRPIKIISIIGRQSSGKSYLLNRVFGTRFSVAATRCTDGIWISFARVITDDDSIERDFIVLDCEGLFSITRNELEEVKLLTVLSAVSDITILNQDLAFSRHLNRLFHDLNDTVDRVKGNNYFRGLLMMAIRDVASEEGEKAAKEFERNIIELNKKGDHQFLARLFSGAIILQCLNSNTNRDVFMTELETVRAQLCADHSKNLGLAIQRWPDAMTLLQSLKIVLLQVNRDDEQAGDEHVKRYKMLKTESRIISAWGDMERTKSNEDVGGGLSHICSGVNPISKEEVSLSQGNIIFQYPPSNDQLEDVAFDVISTELAVRFFGSKTPAIEKTNHNEAWLAFNQLLTGFIAQRINILQDYAEREIAALDHLLSPDERRNFQTGVQEKVRSLGARFALCLNKCSSCHLKCTERKGHNEGAFERRTAIEQRLKELKAKLPTDERLEIAETEQQLSATAKLDEIKSTKIALEQQIANARAKERTKNQMDHVKTRLYEKENEEKDKMARIDELTDSFRETGVDLSLPLQSRKIQVNDQLRKRVEHLFAEDNKSVVAGVRQVFAELTMYAAFDLLPSKLEQQLLDCAAWLDSVLMGTREVKDVLLELNDWHRYFNGFSTAQQALTNFDSLLAESMAEEANVNAALAAAAKELADFEAKKNSNVEKKNELETKMAKLQEHWSFISTELARLKNEDTCLAKLEASAHVCSVTPRDCSSRMDDTDNSALDFCVLSMDSMSAGSTLEPSNQVVDNGDNEKTQKQLATITRRLKEETERLERYKSTGFDSDDENVSEIRLKVVQDKIESLNAKKQALEKQIRESSPTVIQSPEPSEVYDKLLHDTIRAQIVELDRQEQMVATSVRQTQTDFQEVVCELQSRSLQYTFHQLKRKHSGLLLKSEGLKRQATIAESSKMIREDMQSALSSWKPKADVLFNISETQLKINTAKEEIKLIQADEMTLRGQLNDLEEYLSQFIDDDAKPLAELSYQFSVLEEQERSVVAQIANLRFLVEANEQYARLKKELEISEKALECSCTTNHKCDEECSICTIDGFSMPCKHAAGHEDGTHICAKEQHDCPEKCEICSNRCMYAAGHSNPATHKCSSTHQCKATCRFCPNTCTSLVVEEHDDHRCSERHCPKRCIFCGGPCTGPHDHDETTRDIVDPVEPEEFAVAPRRLVKLHLCDKEHRCQQRCEADGICEVHYVEETRYLAHPRNPLEYQYIRPVANRKKCMHVLAPGEWKHDEAHNCKSEEHKCDERCIQCGSFCRQQFGHTGEHQTITHRNMEFCYCVAKTSEGRITVEDTVAGKKAFRVYEPGDVLMAETCVQQCKRKGRSHFHLMPCRGGSNCGEKLYGSGVLHCKDDERFYPDTSVVYDKYLCCKYWRVQNWALPTDDESIHLCNFYCPSREHLPGDPQFCSDQAWHASSSELAVDHDFSCHDFSKAVFAGLDICFCIDATGSMSSFIAECKNAIKRIIADAAPVVTKLGNDTSSFKFAVVAYRDHCDGPNLLQKIDLTTGDKASAFVDSLRATGGGDGPEAVLDGLDSVVSLNWRNGCTRVLIHILDAPPHGRQFVVGGDDHPDGCPCKKKEDAILKAMADKRIQYNVVPLTNYVNKMITVFEKFIPMVRKELHSAVDLPALASRIVCSAIEDAELTATGNNAKLESDLDFSNSSA